MGDLPQWSLTSSPINLVTPAASLILSNKLAPADANPNFTIGGSAFGAVLSWGPGGGAGVDTNLYRIGAGVLNTDSTFRIGAVNGLQFVQGGSTGQIQMDAAGNLYLQTGAANDGVFLRPGGQGSNNNMAIVGPGTAAAFQLQTFDGGGVARSSIFTGTGVPAAGLGANGDWYIRQDTPGTANQRLYVKSAGAWTGIL